MKIETLVSLNIKIQMANNIFNLEELSSIELVEINGGDCPPKKEIKDSFFSTVGCGVAVVVHEIGEAYDKAASWVKSIF